MNSVAYMYTYTWPLSNQLNSTFFPEGKNPLWSALYIVKHIEHEMSKHIQ